MLGDTSFRCIITFQDGSVEKMFILRFRAIKKGDANHALRVFTVLLHPFSHCPCRNASIVGRDDEPDLVGSDESVKGMG